LPTLSKELNIEAYSPWSQYTGKSYNPIIEAINEHRAEAAREPQGHLFLQHSLNQQVCCTSSKRNDKTTISRNYKYEELNLISYFMFWTARSAAFLPLVLQALLTASTTAEGIGRYSEAALPGDSMTWEETLMRLPRKSPLTFSQQLMCSTMAASS